MSQEIPTRRVFISYRSQDPDAGLAKQFRKNITAAGHQCFMAGESLRLGDDWSERVGSELEHCDYFVVLLSSQAATSDMVREEVRRAKLLHDTRPDKRPVILRVDVGISPDAVIDYDLASRLGRFQRAEWRSEADTARISALIIEAMASETHFLRAADEPNMGLTVTLQQKCVRVLMQCWEFKEKSTLEVLFGIEPLPKYVNALPLEVRSQTQLIEMVIHNLFSFPASKGQPLLDLLTVLRDKRNQEEGERKELDDLLKQISFYLSSLAGDAPRNNRALPVSLYHSLRKLLIEECEEFANHGQLLSLFGVENLRIWRPYLPPPGSLNVTVDKVIGELGKRNTRTGENALASLLLVLAERRDPDDQTHSQLLELSRQCQQALSGS